MSRPDKETGKTRLQVLRDIYQQTGVLAAELSELPAVPLEVSHLWTWFCELGAARQVGMDANAISWSDMHAYFALKRIAPEPWELDAIRALDDAYMRSRSDAPSAVVKKAGALKGALKRK